VSGVWSEAGLYSCGWSTAASPAFMILRLQKAICGPLCTPSSTTT